MAETLPFDIDVFSGVKGLLLPLAIILGLIIIIKWIQWIQQRMRQ